MGLSLNCIVAQWQKKFSFPGLFVHDYVVCFQSTTMKASFFLLWSQFVVYVYVLLSFSDSNGPSEWKIVERTNDTLFLTLFLLFLSILARKIRRASFRDFYASFYLYVCAQRPHKISHFHKDNVTWKNSQKWLDGIYKRSSSILTLVISNTVLVFLWVAFTFFWICTASQKAVLYMYSTVELCMRRAVLDGC